MLCKNTPISETVWNGRKNSAKYSTNNGNKGVAHVGAATSRPLRFEYNLCG